MFVMPVIILLGVFSLIIAGLFAWSVLRRPATGGIAVQEQADRLVEISAAIAEGAMAFLMREYRTMGVFMAAFGLLVGFLVSWISALAFIAGAAISILAGFIGMRIATRGNVRTAAAAQRSVALAFRIAFDSGAVMGFGLVGLAVLGLALMYLLLNLLMPGASPVEVMEALAGFGLGGSSIALFARVGGGIYTKAADVGADLVGKVEENIPEDDPRNPAVIADNVGDNVGDIAGMGADLFGSVAESTCAALVIGAVAFAAEPGALLFPLLISAVGIPVALLATFFARTGSERGIEPALKRTLVVATLVMAVAMGFITLTLLPETFQLGGVDYTSRGVYYAFLSGLISGILIGMLTEYYTSNRYAPVREVARASETGPATNIIYGLSLGYKSTLFPVLFIAATVYIGYSFAGMYGIAIASLGMLGTIAATLTIDGFGPVADNAGGIAEMGGLGPAVRKRTDALDSAGNTTAAIGKGFAIGSAALTGLALFSAFLVASGIKSVDLLLPKVLAFLFVGALLPFLFTAMTMKSVGKAALDMIKEVRRQFATIPGLRETHLLTEQGFALLEKEAGLPKDRVSRLRPLVDKAFPTKEAVLKEMKAHIGTLRAMPADEALQKGIDLGFVAGRPDYRTCVDIATRASLREMILPGAQVILTPILVGYLFGVESLAGLLAGTFTAGVVLAISSANAGGGWDNAKKYIEAGNLGGKGSAVHKAAVVGDTVGDPFKDTSGPSLNILIKLQAIISLVFAPFFTHSLNLLG
ncbi:MAG: V-type H(+)-translocating pyrophosphatase [Candidatus Lambdaproteobacteria bacterium]|nr:V-type H(+)-translocating pyrophosphatase [Candidatus Lambdaproteobacteria bacterium]